MVAPSAVLGYTFARCNLLRKIKNYLKYQEDQLSSHRRTEGWPRELYYLFLAKKSNKYANEPCLHLTQIAWRTFQKVEAVTISAIAGSERYVKNLRAKDVLQRSGAAFRISKLVNYSINLHVGL